MSLRDLKNPREAMRLIEAAQKRFREKCCHAPDREQCDGPIVSAHTLSAEAMLRPISRDGHVYTPTPNFFSDSMDEIMRFKLTGIRNTSVFNGFCAHHDRTLFSPIETKPFVCSPEQVFIYAYRAVAKETFLKKCQASTTPDPEAIKKMHGITDANWTPDPGWILHQYGSLIGAQELEAFKARLDTIYLQEDWSRLMTTVVQFERTPTVICGAPYSPDFDYEGNMLQNFGDVERPLETLIVTILPSGTGGFALFSYMDTAQSVCKRMVDSILGRENLTTAIIWFVIGQFENIAIAPDWYDAQSDDLKLKLQKHFIVAADPANGLPNQLQTCPHFIDDWKPTNVFTR